MDKTLNKETNKMIRHKASSDLLSFTYLLLSDNDEGGNDSAILSATLCMPAAGRFASPSPNICTGKYFHY